VANGNRATSNTANTGLLVVLIAILVLYFARTVLIPLALAILLAFLLAPLVIRLRRVGLGRVPSAFAVVLLFFLILGILGAILASQLTDLGRQLPGYQTNIHRKIESVRASGGGVIGRVSRTVSNLTDELTPPTPNPASTIRPEQKPIPVEIKGSAFSPLLVVQEILGSVLSLVLTAVIVIVFVIFMLIEREELRNRFIRLGGARRVNNTTNMLDDATQRVSRYLLAQLVINGVYGALAGTGLYFLGVPNPFLWGIAAALLRYIPYLGIWIAAVMPALLAFAVEPGWMKVPLVFAIYFGIDLLMYNFAEPLLYGSSTGLSPLAILIAAVFWTWLWGPVGLLLATPLTVCVVVLGRHIPRLAFLNILLSDEPVLAPSVRFYQRMLALDLDEATEVTEEFLEDHPVEELYDRVIVPALSLAEEDRHQGRLEDHRRKFLFQNTRLLIEDLSQRPTGRPTKTPKGLRARAEPNPTPEETTRLTHSEVLCVPARDEADEIGALMLAQLLQKQGLTVHVLPAGALAGESVEAVTRRSPAVCCVLAVPPFGFVHARYICRRLRTEFPALRLVGAILTEGAVDEVRQRQPALIADEIAASLREAHAAALSLAALRPASPSQSALAAA
jgi:predicted PurR-regulated permease PerM